MSDDFDPYYLWLGIPPQERPTTHYRLLGVQLFETNPSVIESAADRQMAHLRSMAGGKHSELSQRLLNEVAAAKVCLLRPAQKAKYDEALRAKLDQQASQSASGGRLQPRPASVARPMPQAQPLAASAAPVAASESFWEDVTATDGGRPPAKASRPSEAISKKSPLQRLWPVFLVAGACLLVGVVIVIKGMNGEAEDSTPRGQTVQGVPPKPKESVLVFDWPADIRNGLTLTVDGAKAPAPPSGAWEYHCPPGPHHVIASRAGYKPIDQMVDAPIDGRRKIADAWLPLATLALDWPVENRDGAVLSIDGELLNVGDDRPLIVPVSPGSHTIRISRPGFVTFEKDIPIAIDQHQNLAVALEPASATLVLRWPAGDRAGAELRVDGEVRSTESGSKENVELTLNAGTHSLRVTRPGFVSMTASVTLNAASRKTIGMTWKPLKAKEIATSETGSATAPNTDPKAPGAANGDSAAQVKHPVPSVADQQRIAKQLDGIYKLAHDPTKDLAQSKELCNLALKSEDFGERYMLLLKGAEFAVEAGDFSLALQAADTMDAEFVVAPLEIKEKLLEKLVKIPANADQIADAASNAERLIEDAIAADRYDVATSVAGSAGKLLLKKSVDPDFRRDTEKTLGAYRAQIRAIQPQWELAQKAKQTLETSPDDADANNTLGRWFCFFKGDWATGLPYLEKSGNEKLKPIAQQELKSPHDATQKISIADEWWDAAQKETGAVADAIHFHAGDLYRAALPDLNSVLKKAAVEKRLAEVAEIRSRVGDSMPGQHSGTLVFQRGRWFDILKLVDVSRDATSGTWTRNGSEVVCSGYGPGAPRLNLPVVLDGGYDFEIDFTRTVGASFLHPIFFLGKRPCGLILNASSFSGLDAANGRPLDNFYRTSYGVAPVRFLVGRKYQTVISVRLGKGGVASVDVGIDGDRFLPHWEGDPSVLGVEGDSAADAKQLAIEVGYGGTVTFNAIRLRMVSGQGHFESLSAAQAPNQENPPQKSKLAPGKK